MPDTPATPHDEIDHDLHVRRRLVRMGVVLVPLVVVAGAAILLGPEIARLLTPAPSPPVPEKPQPIHVDFELLSWEGDDLALLVRLEQRDRDRGPLTRPVGGWQPLHISFWNDRGHAVGEERAVPFTFPERTLFGRESRAILPVTLKPPASAHAVSVRWGTEGWRTERVSLSPRSEERE